MSTKGGCMHSSMYTECMIEHSGKARRGESEGVLWRSRSVSVCRVCVVCCHAPQHSAILDTTKHTGCSGRSKPRHQRSVITKFHYTDPTGPDRTRTDFVTDPARTQRSSRRPGLQKGPCGSVRVRASPCGSGRVRSGPCSGI